MTFSKKYGTAVRLPFPLLQRAENLRRTLTSDSGGVPSLVEVVRRSLDLGLSALERGGSHAQ